MISLQNPSQPRIAIGSVVLPDGSKADIIINDEWAKYFFSLNRQVNISSGQVEQLMQQSMMMASADDGAGDAPLIPGPRGPQGDSSPPLFMLQETNDEPMMTPPLIDNVYVPLSSKDASNGVPGLTLFKLNLKNAAGTFINFFTNATTAARTWTMPDKDGTVAVLTDFAAPPALGSTTPAAVTGTTVTATGAFGCNGKAAQISVALGAAAIDLPTVITLANNMRTALIADGIGS